MPVELKLHLSSCRCGLGVGDELGRIRWEGAAGKKCSLPM